MDTTQTFGDSLSTLLLHATEIHVVDHTSLIITNERRNHYEVNFYPGYVTTDAGDDIIINPQRVDVTQTRRTVKYTVTGEDDYSITLRLNPQCNHYYAYKIDRVTFDELFDLFDRQTIHYDKEYHYFLLIDDKTFDQHEAYFVGDVEVCATNDYEDKLKLDDTRSHEGYLVFRSDGDIALTISYDPQEEHYMRVTTINH